MKDYKKYIKELVKDEEFTISSDSRKNTVKVTHVATGEMYSVHPADQAVKPLKSWILKHKKLEYV